jgi:hypothetical protein
MGHFGLPLHSLAFMEYRVGSATFKKSQGAAGAPEALRKLGFEKGQSRA